MILAGTVVFGVAVFYLGTPESTEATLRTSRLGFLASRFGLNVFAAVLLSGAIYVLNTIYKSLARPVDRVDYSPPFVARFIAQLLAMLVFSLLVLLLIY